MYGYARVSIREPEDKNLDLQVERLAASAHGAIDLDADPEHHVGQRKAGPSTSLRGLRDGVAEFAQQVRAIAQGLVQTRPQ